MVEPILRVINLCKRFKGLAVTDGVNLTVTRGELLALIGPNGAGKTTLVHQIFGSLQPDSGTVEFDGVNVTSLPAHRRVRAGLARSYQITNLFPGFSVLDNVALAVQARSGSSLRFWRDVTAETELFKEAGSVIEQVGLSDRRTVLAGKLGYGEQRQLEVAVVMASKPKLVLLDEPLAGMSPDEAEKMVRLIELLKRSLTIVLVEHDMSAVFRLADRISTLVYGKIIATGTPSQIRSHPEVKKAYLGDEVAA
jgi:branched-chain amino acid transport system ATP-binding protein